MKKSISVAFFLISLFLVLLFLGENRDQEKNFLIRGNSFIEGLKIFYKKDGNHKWTLFAKRADIIESENKARLSDITIKVEDKDMTIYAGDGLYDMEKHNLNLYGMIKAVAKDYTIIADSVALDNTTGAINTTHGVRIESKKFNVEGRGMEADSEQKVRILGNVKATFYH